MDECLGGQIIAAELRQTGLDVQIQDRSLSIPRQLSDPDWAKLVADQGWVAVTRDKRIRYRAAEKQAIADAGLALFLLVSRRNLVKADIIAQIKAGAPNMAKFMEKCSPPFIAGIYRSGEIKLREKL